MTERVNLVDAYDNRSVIAKMVNMEERISGAETSVEASAEAAASSASAAAASQTAAKTSETNAKASAETAAATLANTVDLSSKQTVTGAKTFAGDTTVTGSFVTSGNAEMSNLDIDTGKLTIGSGGSAEINGPLTATNSANVIKAANHDSVLTSNDVLTAKDINEVNGKANNLLHRTGGNEPFEKSLPINMTLSNASANRSIWFNVDGALAAWITFTESNGTRQLQFNLRASANADSPASDVYFNIFSRSNGTTGIATNLSKPSNW